MLVLLCDLSNKSLPEINSFELSNQIFAADDIYFLFSCIQVMIAAELLRNADELVKNKIHPTSIISGYKLACK